MRALKSMSINFGLVNIPVKMYGATEERGGIDLDYLHKKDLTPIKYVRVCRADGKEIPFTDIVKGYEYREGDYVVLTDKDLEGANVGKSKTIDIGAFIDEAEVDPLYYEKPYYLLPDAGAERSFALLREALRESGKVGVATFVMRSRERLALLKPGDHVLVVHQLRYHGELRDQSALPMDDVAVPRKELDVALALIEYLTGSFQPKEYRDTYTQELRRVIDEKIKGKHPRAKGAAPQATPASDLMKLLRASVDREQRRFNTGKQSGPVRRSAHEAHV